MSKTPTPPNPLPCGCAVYGRQDLRNARDDGTCLIVPWTEHHVRHCPLHAAASDLLAALKVYLNAGHKDARHAASIQAKAAIAKAQPEVSPCP